MVQPEAGIAGGKQVSAAVLYPNNLGQLLWELHGPLVTVPVH